MEIVKKTYSDFFEDVLQGKKNFELRISDFEVNEGDELVLVEIDKLTRERTGREIRKKVNYVLKTKDCDFYKKEDVNKYGFVIMGLED